MTTIRRSASILGITLGGMACVLAACFGPPFTLRAPPTEPGEGGAGMGGHGGVGAAGGGVGGVEDNTTLVIQDSTTKPIADVKIVVNDEAGTVVMVTASDDTGRAEVTIPIGGSVSIYFTVETALRIRSIVDPPPGLTIPLILEHPVTAQLEKTSYQAVIVAQPLGTDRVYVWSTCDSAWSDMILDNEACRDAPSLDFLAVAYDAEENAIGWGILEDQATSPGGDTIFIPLDVTQTAFHTLDAAITGTLPPTSYAGVTVSADLAVEALMTLPSPIAPPPIDVTLLVPAVPGMGYRIHEFAWSWPDAAGPLSQIERDRHSAVLPASSTFAVRYHPHSGWLHEGPQRGPVRNEGSYAPGLPREGG
jgi:hypothetical protein